MRRVVVPRASGVLSALGLIVSERRRDLVESVLLTGGELTREAIAEAVARLGGRGREELGADGAELRASYDLRYAGQAFELTIPGEPSPDPARAPRARSTRRTSSATATRTRARCSSWSRCG